MSKIYDVIIIGGGHNALVCANILSKKNKKVLICEARDECGGLLTNQLTNFIPGLHKNVTSSIDAISTNLRSIKSIALSETGQHLKLSGNKNEDQKTLEGFSAEDADNFLALEKKLSLFSKTLGAFMQSSPPRIMTNSFSDNFKIFNLD